MTEWPSSIISCAAIMPKPSEEPVTKMRATSRPFQEPYYAIGGIHALLPQGSAGPRQKLPPESCHGGARPSDLQPSPELAIRSRR